MIAETERVRLRKATIEDAPFLRRLMNSPGWLRYIGDRQIKTDADAEAYVRNSLLESYRKHGFGLYVVEHSEQSCPIGICGLLKRDHLDAPDLGFATLPEYERQGLTSEAVRAVLKHAQEDCEIAELLAIVLEENQPSRNLLSRFGFKQSGTVPSERGGEVLLYRHQGNC
ncbi:MAG: GNAT family N-acetyltransferase [Candidatus Eremiobacteraeota bacterium]|nr:GNAT family N-acetyltransferase [Candidatus Eremiobacteraeota bacterium]